MLIQCLPKMSCGDQKHTYIMCKAVVISAIC